MKYLEDNKTELKRELIDDVKKEIVAFLNTKGGNIYVGVNDDGTLFLPFFNQSKDELSLKVSSWLQEAFFPIPSNLVSFYFNEENILVIEVSEGLKKPYYLREKGPKPSGVYKRSGTSIRKCNDDEILKMIMDSNHYVYEIDISDEQDLSFKYFAKICEEKNYTINDQLFIKLGLVHQKCLFHIHSN